MSIPERLSRIVRHKLSEFKDKFDQMDEEALADPAEMDRLRRAESRIRAKQELEDAMEAPRESSTSNSAPRSSNPSATARVDVAPKPLAPKSTMRTPQQIASTSAHAPQAVAADSAQDSLDYHYRMLGIEPGADLSEVQKAYVSLAARTDPSRFPAGSQEARELDDIRSRLETSYRALRDSLDSTAHRFGMLEFDPKPAS